MADMFIELQEQQQQQHTANSELQTKLAQQRQTTASEPQTKLAQQQQISVNEQPTTVLQSPPLVLIVYQGPVPRVRWRKGWGWIC